MFIPAVLGLVITTTYQIVRHILLRRHGTRSIMGVLVTLVVAQLLHQFGGCIAQVQGNRTGPACINIGKRIVDGHIGGV